MHFDMVHDIQTSYRQVVTAFSYPATIQSISKQANRFEIDMECNPALSILMTMLLDADTSFSVVSKKENVARKASQITYCPLVKNKQARFIFVTEDCFSKLPDIIREANIGTLIDPHLSATIIVSCDEISENTHYIAKGPGILSKNCFGIVHDCDWLKARNEVNSELPLGIDLLFVDKQYHILALPRTTKVERI